MVKRPLFDRSVSSNLRRAVLPYRLALAGLALFTAAATLIDGSAARAQDVLRIAAVVNDKVISVRDLAARTHFIIISSDLPNTPQTHRRLWPRVLDGLIDETLKLEEAERFGIQVTERDLDNGKSIIEQRHKIPAGTFESFLRRQGIDTESALNQMRAEIAWSKLVRQRFSNLASVSEDEVQDAISRYEENVGKPQARVQEILLRIEDPTRETEVRGLGRADRRAIARWCQLRRFGAGIQPECDGGDRRRRRLGVGRSAFEGTRHHPPRVGAKTGLRPGPNTLRLSHFAGGGAPYPGSLQSAGPHCGTEAGLRADSGGQLPV